MVEHKHLFGLLVDFAVYIPLNSSGHKEIIPQFKERICKHRVKPVVPGSLASGLTKWSPRLLDLSKGVRD